MDQTKNADPRKWGPSLWVFLHIMAAHFPQNPTPAQRVAVRQLLMSLKLLLPCEVCRQHFSTFLSQRPLQIVSGRQLQEWLLWLHNKVNETTGKNVEWTLEDAEKVYLHFDGEPIAKNSNTSSLSALAESEMFRLPPDTEASNIIEKLKATSDENDPFNIRVRPKTRHIQRDGSEQSGLFDADSSELLGSEKMWNNLMKLKSMRTHSLLKPQLNTSASAPPPSPPEKMSGVSRSDNHSVFETSSPRQQNPQENDENNNEFHFQNVSFPSDDTPNFDFSALPLTQSLQPLLSPMAQKTRRIIPDNLFSGAPGMRTLQPSLSSPAPAPFAKVKQIVRQSTRQQTPVRRGLATTTGPARRGCQANRSAQSSNTTPIVKKKCGCGR